MLSPLKRVFSICGDIQRRAYCISKIPPPGSNPNHARKVPWSPYDQIVHDRESHYVEDAMEFRAGDGPYQRSKGKQQIYHQFIEKMNKKWRHGYTTRQKLEKARRLKLVQDQLFNPERVKALGPDLAVAHFIIARGGGVKFIGQEGFIQPGVNKAHQVLPGYRDDSFKVEAINAVNYHLVFEGLLQLSDLQYLKWISFKGNTSFDNYCMDRLSLVAPNLEFINLDGCIKIDQNAFGCLYRFKKLKCICVENTNQTDLFKLTCLMLESEYPDLVFIGIEMKAPRKSIFNS